MDAGSVDARVLGEHEAQTEAVEHGAAAQHARWRKARGLDCRARERVHGVGDHQQHRPRRAAGDLAGSGTQYGDVFLQQIAARLARRLIRARGHHRQIRIVDDLIAAALDAHAGQKGRAVGNVQRLAPRLVFPNVSERDLPRQARLRQGERAARTHLSRADDGNLRHADPPFALSLRRSARFHARQKAPGRAALAHPDATCVVRLTFCGCSCARRSRRRGG